MSLAFLLLKDRTNSIVTNSVVFNAPGIYYPPYGKAVFQITGQGSPGNTTVPGNVSGNNSYTTTTPVPASGGNVEAYVPASGGNYAGTNAYTYSTYVDAVPPSYAGINPATPGNSATNPAIPGNTGPIFFENYAVASVNNTYITVNYYYSSRYIYAPQGTPQPAGSYRTQYNPNTYDYIYIDYYNNGTYDNSIPGNVYTNPATPGNIYYNPYYPAYTYDTYVPGNPIYNPYYPGYSNYNPYVPAYTYTTPVPGNPNYNPTVSGTAGTNYTVLGVPFPGGAADSSAPVIGLTTIVIDYTNAGTPISVPPGGYITVYTKPKTAP
jgi:hypothetical protein